MESWIKLWKYQKRKGGLKIESTLGRRGMSDLMKVIGVVQFILSVLGLISLGSLLLMRDKVVSTVSNEELMLSESTKLDAVELTPLSIIISMVLLTIALVLAVYIFRSIPVITKNGL